MCVCACVCVCVCVCGRGGGGVARVFIGCISGGELFYVSLKDGHFIIFCGRPLYLSYSVRYH